MSLEAAKGSMATGGLSDSVDTMGRMAVDADAAVPAQGPVSPTAEVPVSGSAVACASKSVFSTMAEPLMTHLNKAHLETSPGQQVADLLSVDQYVKTHTVLAESIAAPTLDKTTGTTACG